MCCPNVGQFVLLAFLGVFLNVYEKLPPWNKIQVIEKEERYGNSSIRIKLICFKKAYLFFEILQISRLCFDATNLSVSVVLYKLKRSGISKIMWPSKLGVGLFCFVHTEFLLCMQVRYGNVTSLSWFSFSFIICTSFWNAFYFNIIIQTFKFYKTEWGDTLFHVFIKHIMVTLLWPQWMEVKHTNMYIYLTVSNSDTKYSGSCCFLHVITEDKSRVHDNKRV